MVLGEHETSNMKLFQHKSSFELTVSYQLSDYATEDDVIAAVNDISQSRGDTNTAAALRRTRTKYLSKSQVHRIKPARIN